MVCSTDCLFLRIKMKTYSRLMKEEEKEMRRRILFIEETFENITGFARDVIQNSYTEEVYRFRDRIIQKGTAAKKLYLVYEGGALVNISYGVKSGEKTQLPLKTEDKKVSKDIKELRSGFLIGLYECRNSVPFDYNVFSSQSSTVLFGLDHEVGDSSADHVQTRSQGQGVGEETAQERPRVSVVDWPPEHSFVSQYVGLLKTDGNGVIHAEVLNERITKKFESKTEPRADELSGGLRGRDLVRVNQVMEMRRRCKLNEDNQKKCFSLENIEQEKESMFNMAFYADMDRK
jgi:hypothetical protein